MIPYELLQGLNKLACKSKDKRIEELFVKLANRSETDFSNWILKNQNNPFLSNKLGDSEVLSALAHLTKMKNEPPPTGWMNYMVQKAPSYIPIYGAFLRLLRDGDPDIQSVLAPFQTILPYFSSSIENDWMPDSSVATKLNGIIGEFNEQLVDFDDDYHPVIKKKMTREEKRQEKAKLYFDYFFEHSSKEIYNAIESLGSPDNLKELKELIAGYKLPDTKMIIPFCNYRFDSKDQAEVSKVVNATIRTILSPRYKGQPYHAFEKFRAEAQRNLGRLTSYEYQALTDRSSGTPQGAFVPFSDQEQDPFHEDDESEVEEREQEQEQDLYKFEPTQSLLPKYVFASSLILRELYEIGSGR